MSSQPDTDSTQPSVQRASNNQAAFIHDSREHEELIRVFGEVDLSNEDEFEGALARLCGLHRPVVVDLTSCTYMDSSGFHVLERMSKRAELRLIARERGGVHKLFEVLNADKFLTIQYVKDSTLRVVAQEA